MNEAIKVLLMILGVSNFVNTMIQAIIWTQTGAVGHTLNYELILIVSFGFLGVILAIEKT